MKFFKTLIAFLFVLFLMFLLVLLSNNSLKNYSIKTDNINFHSRCNTDKTCDFWYEFNNKKRNIDDLKIDDLKNLSLSNMKNSNLQSILQIPSKIFDSTTCINITNSDLKWNIEILHGTGAVKIDEKEYCWPSIKDGEIDKREIAFANIILTSEIQNKFLEIGEKTVINQKEQTESLKNLNFTITTKKFLIDSRSIYLIYFSAFVLSLNIVASIIALFSIPSWKK